MTNEFPRVALFADSFHEVNGMANVIRRLTQFAATRNRPFLCVRSGAETKVWQTGSVTHIELQRGKRAITVDADLAYDPLLWRYKKFITAQLDEFRPDVLHLTGLNDMSQLGFPFAHYRNLPAVASWHTNTHEYAARRLCRMMAWMLPAKVERKLNHAVERFVWRGLMRLHFLAQVQLAPSVELVRQIEKMTDRPSFLMSRGVDTEFLNPVKRTRAVDDNEFVLGFVGRLRTEKNVKFLLEVERALQAANVENYRFLIIGEGSEAEWLQQNLRRVELTGVLRGEALAEAFANMDLMVFPSKTDAFGNVVLEAMAAGVPGVVMPEGGPKFLIENNVNGFIAVDDADFLRLVVRAAKNPAQIRAMKLAARRAAEAHSWDAVFESVYDAYRLAVKLPKNTRASKLINSQTTYS